MTKKILSVLAAALILLGVFSGCNRNKGGVNTPSGNNADTATVKEIRYLNFKPEIAEVYDRISAAYEKEKGIKDPHT